MNEDVPDRKFKKDDYVKVKDTAPTNRGVVGYILENRFGHLVTVECRDFETKKPTGYTFDIHENWLDLAHNYEDE